MEKSDWEITDQSLHWGNYDLVYSNEDKFGGVKPTGSWEHCRSCNIYDMAGNVWEYTLGITTKGANNGEIVIQSRGSTPVKEGYNQRQSNGSAVSRNLGLNNTGTITNKNEYYGFRVIMVI